MIMGKKLLPDRLKTIREALGITSAEAARRTGADKSTYAKYESGAAFPSAPMLRVMALYLGTSVAYLTWETDDPAPDVLPVAVDSDNVDFVSDFTDLGEEERRAIREIIRLFKQK